MEEPMPESTPTKDDLLAAIGTERHYWNALVALVEQEGLLDRQIRANGPTFKETAAHVNSWRALTVARFEAAQRGSGPPAHPWPEGMGEDSRVGVNEINAWSAERDRERPAAEVLAEASTQFDALSAAVAAMSDDDLLTPGRFVWLGDLPIGPALLGYSFTHLHTDHVPEICTWLQRETGREPNLPPVPPRFGYGE
jgi:hypothetical protein